MTRTNEATQEEKHARWLRKVGNSIDGGLSGSITRNGGELTGLTAKLDNYDCLLVIKALFPAGPQVSFVGGSSLGDCLVKAWNESKHDRLRWKADKWG